MWHQRTLIGGLASIGLLLWTASGSTAEMPSHSSARGAFERLEQPLGVKLGVAAGGLCLMGLELWWFLFSKPK